MRPPCCQETDAPCERFFAFLPLSSAWRSQQLGAWSDVIAVCRWHPHVAAPHTYGGSVATCMAMAENRECAPLRPSNDAVPSDRPRPRAGGACPARQFASGSGEGQPTPALCDPRRLFRSQSGCPLNGSGSGIRGLYTPERSEVQPKRACRVFDTGCSREASGAPALLL
jgi:hypothetical protein